MGSLLVQRCKKRFSLKMLFDKNKFGSYAERERGLLLDQAEIRHDRVSKGP